MKWWSKWSKIQGSNREQKFHSFSSHFLFSQETLILAHHHHLGGFTPFFTVFRPVDQPPLLSHRLPSVPHPWRKVVLMQSAIVTSTSPLRHGSIAVTAPQFDLSQLQLAPSRHPLMRRSDGLAIPIRWPAHYGQRLSPHSCSVFTDGGSGMLTALRCLFGFGTADSAALVFLSELPDQ